MMNRFREGKLTHLISVEVIGEGTDVPSVPVVATIRSTASIAVWLQQSGRGSRPKGEDGGYYTLLDFASNAANLGMPNQPRDWFLEARDEREGGEIGGFIARCFNHECKDVTLHPSHRSCWNCGEDQYRECNECHDDRRWTRYAGDDETCSICVEALSEYEARASREKDQRRKEINYNSFSYKKKERLKEEAKNHVDPSARSKKKKTRDRQRMSSYISTLNKQGTGSGIEAITTNITFEGETMEYTEGTLF